MQPEMKGKHIALLTARDSSDGVLSTEPLIISAHLSGIPGKPVRELLDSGTNVPLLYDSGKAMAGGFPVSAPIRDRAPDGAERVFAVLPPQDMQIGTLTFHQISFVTPVGTGKYVPRVEVDALLPTALFRRVFISYADRYVVHDPW